MLNSVLIPLDGLSTAESVLAIVLPLLPDDGSVLLLRVIPPLDPLLPDLLDQVAETPLSRARQEAAQSDLDAAGQGVDAGRRRWTSEIAEGDPAEQILRVAAERGVDLIAMTTHGHGAIGRVLFGSVADRIVRRAPMPVLLVRPGTDGQVATPRIRRIVVPLDGSALAEAAVPVASALAKRLGAPITLLRAVDADLPDHPVGNPEFSDFGEQLALARLETARDALQPVIDQLEHEGQRASAAVLDGSPYFVLAEALRPDDLLVLTSHGRGGALRWLLGSVAEKLVRTAPCPILLVPSPERRRGNGA